MQREETPSSDEDSEPVFATPSPIQWHEFTTLISNTGRRREMQYIKGRLLVKSITPTVIRVQEKVEKVADRIILAGQLSTELLAATKAKEKERKERNEAPNKVVQKYREIYGNITRRQIAEDKEKKRRVVNIREK